MSAKGNSLKIKRGEAVSSPCLRNRKLLRRIQKITIGEKKSSIIRRKRTVDEQKEIWKRSLQEIAQKIYGRRREAFSSIRKGDPSVGGRRAKKHYLQHSEKDRGYSLKELTL